jgi:hypothetical protein
MRYLFFAIVLFALPTVTQATEEPDYAVVRKLGDIEVRFYASYVVAQMLVAGPEDQAVTQGFPILAETNSLQRCVVPIWVGSANLFTRDTTRQ